MKRIHQRLGCNSTFPHVHGKTFLEILGRFHFFNDYVKIRIGNYGYLVELGNNQNLDQKWNCFLEMYLISMATIKFDTMKQALVEVLLAR